VGKRFPADARGICTPSCNPFGEGRSLRYATFNVLAPEPVQRKEAASRLVLVLDAMHTGNSQNLWR